MENLIDSELRIECLSLSIQVYNVLKRAQINILSELLAHTSVELLELNRFGPACLSAVNNALESIGYPIIDSDLHSTQTMTHQLYFVPRVLIGRDGTKRVIQADTEVKLQLICKELNNLFDASSDLHLKDHLSDAIDSINEVLDHFGDPGDSFGEPPVTMREMHDAAWQQHKEMHS